jgi:hypothetical protein
MDVDIPAAAVIHEEKENQIHIPDDSCLSLPFAPLKDDLDCVRKLSRGQHDEENPSFRLLFLFRVIYMECGRNRQLSIDTWLRLIEGVEGFDDLWLWEDGDEDWLRLNIKDPSFTAVEHNIYLQDWKQAGLALNSRLSRTSNRLVIRDAPYTRVAIIGWRLLVSGYMADANAERGLTPRHDSALDVRAWYQYVHQLFYLPDLNHVELRSTFFPSLRGDTHHCVTDVDLAMINDWATMMSKIHFRESLVGICKKMCGCDTCSYRYELSGSLSS